MLVAAFAFAGNYMGQNADAHNAMPDESLDVVVAPTTSIIAKGSLLPDGGNFDLGQSQRSSSKQTVVSQGKGDYVDRDRVIAIRIEPAAVELTPKRIESAVQRLAMTPPVCQDREDLQAEARREAEGHRPAPHPARRRKLPRPRHLFRGPLRIGTGPARGGQGDPQSRQGSGLSQDDLRRRLSGFRPPQFLPVLLRLRRPARRCEAAGRLGRGPSTWRKRRWPATRRCASSAPPPTIMPTTSIRNGRRA